MKLLDYLKENILYLDGGMGTLLQAEGLQPGEQIANKNTVIKNLFIMPPINFVTDILYEIQTKVNINSENT